LASVRLPIVFLFGPTGGGDDAVAKLVEDRDRYRTHSTCSTGHEHSAAVWGDACLFQGEHAKHSGMTGGADRHGFRRRNVIREPDKPVAFDARTLSVATMAHLAQTVAIQYDAISRLEARIPRAQHVAGQVDAWDERKFANISVNVEEVIEAGIVCEAVDTIVRRWKSAPKYLLTGHGKSSPA